MTESRVWHLGEFRIEPDLGTVNGRYGEARLMPRTMDVLVYLLENASRVVPAVELLDAFWPDRIVDASTIHRRISQIRQALGESAGNPSLIATVPKRGYRVIGSVIEPVAASHTPSLMGQEQAIQATQALEHPHQVPFVGRKDVLHQLETHLEAAQAGTASVVFLMGPPGIGKTRCAQEFTDLARQRGHAVYSAWCDEHAGSAPYWPWVNILRAIFEAGGADSLQPEFDHHIAAIRELLPELATRFPDLPALPELEAGEHRVRLYEAVVALLRHLSGSAALVLFIDDLHLADRASLSMFEFVARSTTANHRLLLLGTARDAELGRKHAFTETLATLTRRSRFERVALDGLSRTELNQLVANLTGESDRVIDIVLAKTDGNPLYATLLAKALTKTPDDALPANLREVIIGTFAGLSDLSWEVVSAAAVIGREFMPDLLSAITGIDETALTASMLEARNAGVLAPGGQFSHMLVQEAVYQEIPPAERRELHRRIARRLSVQPAELMDVASVTSLARHCAQSGEAVEAAVWYRRALSRMAGIHDRQAYECSRLALDALESGLAKGFSQTLGRWIVRSTIGAIHTGGDAQIPGDEVALLYQRARDVAVRLDDSERQRSLLATVYSDYLEITGKLDEALQCAREAWKAADSCGDEGTRLHAVITLIQRLEILNRRSEADRVAQREIDDPPADLLASFEDGSWSPYPRILTFSAASQAARGSVVEALQQVRDLLQLYRHDSQQVAPEDLDVGRDGGFYRCAPQPLLECIEAAAACFFYQGDVCRLAKCAEHYSDWITKHRIRYRPRSDRLIAQTYCLERRWQDLAAIRIQGSEYFPGHTVDPYLVSLQALALAHLDDRAGATQLIRRLLPGEDIQCDTQTLINLARASIRLGDNESLGTAHALTDAIEGAIDQSGSEANRPFLLEIHGQLALVAGKDEDCQQLRSRAQMLWRRMGADAHIEHMTLELGALVR